MFARQGYRTIVYAIKELDVQNHWDFDWDNLEQDQIESDLTLLAATGVEDLLQDNVKKCIEDFRHAGIAVWMLTGDKSVTAKEIGMSCGLIPTHSPGLTRR